MDASQEITPFQFEQHNVRVVTDNDGSLWFNSNDVCAALDLSNPRESLSKHVSPEDVIQRDTLSVGGVQKTNHVNESGMYGLLFGSRKPAARRFKKWVTAEIIPSIRKTGKYEVVPTDESRMQADMAFFDFTMRTLRPSQASRILMMKKFCEIHDRCLVFSPDYAELDYSDEKITRSLTDLLKQYKIKPSTRSVNKILLEIGILENKTRPTSKGGVKKFKSLTAKGLEYGKNLVSKQNEKETQPHYFEDTFQDLVELIRG